jgi:CheY-like chemotaxis protein
MKKILIIEDDQIVANVYRNKFTVEGFQVEIALDGEAGLELVKTFRPDAVVLDLMLPKVTGVEVMKKIRSDPESGKVPVIVFSNTYLTNMVQEAWKAGATKCLSKANSSPKQVIDVVRNAIGNNGVPGDVRPQPAKIVPGLRPADATAPVFAPPQPAIREMAPASSPAFAQAKAPASTTQQPTASAQTAARTPTLPQPKLPPPESPQTTAPMLALAQTATPALPAAAPKQAATPAPERTISSESDAEFQAELRKSFIEGLPATLTLLRTLLHEMVKTESEMARLKPVHELYRRFHALAGNAGIAGMVPIAHMADALEALLKELYEKPKNINASTLRTVSSAIDFLAVLFERGPLPEQEEAQPASVLVVDDEAISRRAVTYALEKAKLKSLNVEEPAIALKLLSENHFDLIFLDVDMPGMNGFELCAKLRALPEHKHTPVVFVTSLNDFESRASSTMSGGNDFIAKPFLFIELAVKALVYVMRGKLDQAK